MIQSQFTRRGFMAAASAAAASTAYGAKKRPVGLELFSVRQALQKDLFGTVTAVAKMGYDGMEFFSPYYSWTTDYAKQVRKLLDDLNVKCLSTHNGPKSFADDGMAKAVELNGILGSRYIVMASAGRVEGLDGWKKVAERLNAGAEKFKTASMGAGYHNHQLEFKPIDGKRPMEVLAANTGKDVMLQLDVGTCIEAGSDPIAWINANKGRIKSMHCKDWKQGEGYKVLVGEGQSPWKQLFKTAEKVGGVEYYLVEQEGSRFSEFETAEKCLAAFKKLHG